MVSASLPLLVGAPAAPAQKGGRKSLALRVSAIAERARAACASRSTCLPRVCGTLTTSLMSRSSGTSSSKSPPIASETREINPAVAVSLSSGD